MSSLENYCEQIERLLLKAQPYLAGISVVRQDEDDHAEMDRIIVSAAPRETELSAPDGITQIVVRIPVTVTAKMVTRSAEQMDRIVRAIEAAQSCSAPAALAIALAHTPNGLFINPTDKATRESAGNSRTESRTFDFVVTLPEN